MDFSVWDVRAERAVELAEKYDFARDLLSFYREIVLFQKALHSDLFQSISEDVEADGSCPLHGGGLAVHLPLLLTFFPSFLALIKRVGSEELSQLAGRLATAARQPEWPRLLDGYWKKELPADDGPDGLALLFFPKTFLQPYAELLADRHAKQGLDDQPPWQVAQGGGARCPLCDSRPQLSILRSEADGAKRSLLCALCATEWRYKRVCCPACGEERFAKLSYHMAADFPHVRVEVCESCQTYIKGIDLTVNGLAVPVVDEIATLPLDLWAAEQGYKKIEMNLVGV